MAYTQLADGVWWPWAFREIPINTAAAGTLDAAGEKYAMIGRVKIAGSPGTSKTINTTGSSKISWQGGSTAVFDHASTSLSVGIQGVSTGAGQPAQPDGSFSVTAVITTSADASPALTTASSWHDAVPTTGTVTLSDGDLIAVVWDLTARGGADAIQVTSSTYPAGTTLLPNTNAFAAAAWGATGSNLIPNVLLTASDGTLITIDGAHLFGTASNQSSITDAANPDEYGTIFQVPFACKVDAIGGALQLTNTDSDFTLYLVSSPTSSRNNMTSIAVDAMQTGPSGTMCWGSWNLATPVALAANTDYSVSFKATNTGEIRLRRMTLGNGGARAFYNGGTTISGTTANNGGDFAAGSTTVLNSLAVRISAIDFAAGSAGGQLIGC